jgi:hypothetical protein
MIDGGVFVEGCSQGKGRFLISTSWKSQMRKQKLKDRFHRTFMGNILEGYRIRKTYRQWLSKGKPQPVHRVVKQMTVKAFAQKYGIRVFIETGTYLGDMVAAVKDDFDRIYSIELSEDLYKQAKKKFTGYKHITIVHADSSQAMPGILSRIDAPCLFWLDSHYSAGITAGGEKETPIWEELGHICKHPINNHVILIDDARLFTGENNYPTLEFLKTFIESRLPDCEFDTQNDIIRIYNKL